MDALLAQGPDAGARRHARRPAGLSPLGFKDVYTHHPLLRREAGAGGSAPRPARRRSGRCERTICRRSPPTTERRSARDAAHVLADLHRRLPAGALVAERRRAASRGFVLGRDGRACAQIGPLVAEDAATAVGAVAWPRSAGIAGPVCIDRRRSPRCLRSAASKRRRLRAALALHTDDPWPQRALRRSRTESSPSPDRSSASGRSAAAEPRAPERTREQILQAAIARVRRQGARRSAGRRHRRAGRRQQAHDLSLLRQQGGAVPGGAGAHL